MTDEISFKFEKVYHFNSLVYLIRVANETVVAVSKNVLLRFSLNDPYSLEEIKIPSENDLAHSLFIDPSGKHVIICMQSNQTFYLEKSSKKARLVKEAKNLLIEAIGWNVKYSKDNSTQFILIGTSTGDLIEARLSNGNLEQYWTKIYSLDQTITGILFDSYQDFGHSKYFLIITTPTSIYPFQFNLANLSKGNPLFTAEFERINLQPGGAKCTTFPFDFGYSDLDQYCVPGKTFPNYIAWMNGAGIYWATLNQNSIEAEGNIFLKPKLLNYSKTKQNFKPINVATTEFHIILQYADIIEIFCIIHDEIVYTYKCDMVGNEKFCGLCKDQSTGFIYMYTNANLYLINCDGETKNLWRTYAKLGQYEEAEKYCKNEHEKIKIKLKQSDCLFDQQKYSEAGKLYASTSLPFEVVTLKFIDIESKEGLMSYLLEYASKYELETPNSQNSYDIICMWLLELFFEQINSEQFKSGNDITSKSFKEKNPEFKKFVEEPKIIKSLKRNKALIYEKIKNYGDFYQSAVFAEIIEDNIQIMAHHIEKGNMKEALRMLANEKSNRPHYQFGAKIISTHPHELVDIWIKMSQKLDPKKILPIIRMIDDEIAIKYVKHMITNQTSVNEELPNFYVLLCAKLANQKKLTSTVDPLMEYLRNQGLNILQTNYDPQLALRVCMEWNHLEGSVFLHCLLNKHIEAVELALKEGNVELAEKVAVEFTGSDEDKKHLWLQIARFIIEENKNVQEVCRLVKSQHSLKLEDILPYFPDSVKIEDFSEAICDSLNFYNDHIENLKQDMKLATEYATKTREEIDFLKERPISVQRETVCVYCNELLTLRPFCLFPCKHFFHIHCLEKVAIPMLSVDCLSQLADIREHLSLNSGEENLLKNEYLKNLTHDCCYCGSITINIIDQPIIGISEFNIEMKKWE